ncbi:hypothetical protein pipiens_008991 [Culex pipiens pipiens]|uniref:Programmed cell death protein 2 C-terminal domain-containing protein n=1 Tax=Culex pipiens pipiens TaxID=38569 RepID=A0ABD1DJ31_CULPP
MESSVDLGFLEPCEEWLLANKFFRSKVGGKPAWLELKNLPAAKDLLCGVCGEPCVFLCQVYAPLEEKESCFHRMVYLFVCAKASCYEHNQSKNILAFRSQLPRTNDFYGFNPPDESKKSDPIPSPIPLCTVCGCRGSQQCSRCKKVNYCGFEIVTEPEEIDAEPKLSAAEAERKQMEEYERLVSEGKTGELSELPESELDNYSGQIEDKHFDKFKKRIEADPDQILRYDRKGAPLWLSPVVPESIPACDQCGGPRKFEFQIMPQLLNSLKNENIDWGTLAVYTCEQSCDPADRGYVKEFVYKQDVVNTEPQAPPPEIGHE